MEPAETNRRILRSSERSIETVARTIDTLHGVIDQNRRLAKIPEHEATAMQRVAEGEAELRILRTHLLALRRKRDHLRSRI